MSLAGAVLGGSIGANAGGNLLLNYTRNQYQEKIDQLESCKTRLDAHLAQLEAYQQQLYNFWTGENAEEYFAMIGVQIMAVRSAQTRVETTLQNWQEVVDKMEHTKETVSELTGGATNVLKDLASLGKGSAD